MKFLEEIAALKDQAEALRNNLAQALVAKNDLSDTIGDVTRQLADVQRALANVPQPITVKLNGQDLQIAERDALMLFAALVRTLEGEEVPVRLSSGQTLRLKLTDLEQIASNILLVST